MQAATRQEQKAATRDRLVNAAMALFARKGIVQTTTADIARSIRMSHGVVFLHFPKRDDLVIGRRSRRTWGSGPCCRRTCACWPSSSPSTRGW